MAARKFGFTRLVAVLIAAATAACATSPTGRKQLILVPNDTMNSMGLQAFNDMKSQLPVDQSPAVNDYVKCVVIPITRQVNAEELGVKNWEVVVFKDDTPNAFALPGGKIGVHTGLLKVAKTDGQVAAVLGHEVGHVIARHGAERTSQQLAATGAILGTGVALGDNPNKGLIIGALGVGATYGILMPYGRSQESESDVIGLDLMARAGFDPRQSVELWKNMAAAGGANPPAFLSTHPSHGARQSTLNEHMKEALGLYEDAQAKGRKPECKRP